MEEDVEDLFVGRDESGVSGEHMLDEGDDTSGASCDHTNLQNGFK